MEKAGKFRHIFWNCDKKYPPNVIRNQKYRWYTFFFAVLMQQFKQFLNIFLFVISVSQLKKDYLVTSLTASIGPWFGVLIFSLLKEGIEDFRRYERDNVTNGQLYSKFTNGGFVKIPSSKIKVGDLILVEKNERIPADMVLVKTSDVSGQVFIRTDQLDGETDWKLRLAVPCMQSAALDEIKRLRILAEKPWKDIYSFMGKMKIGNFYEKDLLSAEGKQNNDVGVFERIEQLFDFNFGASDNAILSVFSEREKETSWVYRENGFVGKTAITDDSSTGKYEDSANTELKEQGFFENMTHDEVNYCKDGVGEEEQIVENEEQRENMIFDEEGEFCFKNGGGLHNEQAKSCENVNELNNMNKGCKGVFEGEEFVITDRSDDVSTQRNIFDDITTTGMDEELGYIENDERQKEDAVYPLSCENMVWMNTVAATCSVLGCVIYTGKDTRAMLNTSKPRNKISIIEVELDNHMKILGAICFFFSGIFTYTHGFGSRLDIIFVRFLVILSSMIPVSLKISVEFIRYFHGRNISMDERIEGAVMRSGNLCEELGRISYFLTDKTGTLTKNEMEMKKVHLGTICYTKELNDEISKSMARVLNRKTDTKSVFSRGKKDISVRVYELVQALSVCHNVTPVISDNDVTYQASSPDEVAIVRWTETVGMKLYKRDRTAIIIKDPLNDEQVYHILHVFPFTSETKRMGIIVRYGDEIMFFVKGADVVMRKIIKSNDWVEEETDNMARDGLRTLVIAKRMLSKKTFNLFDRLYNNARTSLTGRKEAIEQAMRVIEKEMTVLGLTGVEDKLQDFVKTTLENLKNAGIKIWMLTGDKIETAISISKSSRIFNRNSVYLVIDNASSVDEVREKLSLLCGSDYNSLVIDGQSLSHMIGDEDYMDEFIRHVSELDAVVGCRYSPTQKAIVAKKLKERTKKCVCCIGDGGNDVSMITEADVGVGIVGKEGNQASLAGDFSVNKFHHVLDLLLWHGRNSYQKTSKVSHLIIHRGALLGAVQAIFCMLLHFLPVGLFMGELQMLFVTIYSFIPIISIAYSSDVSRGVVMKFPELYKELAETKLLSYGNFSTWMLVAFYQGTVMMITFYLWKQEFFLISTLIFTSLIINELLMVALTATRMTPAMVASFAFSLITYAAHFAFRSELLRYEESFFLFLLKVLTVNGIAILVSVFQRLWIRYTNPSAYSKLETFV